MPFDWLQIHAPRKISCHWETFHERIVPGLESQRLRVPSRHLTVPRLGRYRLFTLDATKQYRNYGKVLVKTWTKTLREVAIRKDLTFLLVFTEIMAAHFGWLDGTLFGRVICLASVVGALGMDNI